MLGLSASGRTIGVPASQPKAAANSSRFESGPRTRHFPGLCGSVFRLTRSASSRIWYRQTVAWLRKKRWAGVRPSTGAAPAGEPPGGASPA